MNNHFVIGGMVIVLGLALIPLLSIYSFFVSIPIVITGICILVSGLVKVIPNKIVMGTSSILGIYYMGMYLFMISNQAYF